MEFIIACILLFLFTTCTLVCFSSTNNKSTKQNLPPGPSPLPILGNLLLLGKKPHRALAQLAHIHGPIMALKLGRVTTIVVSSPEMAKEVLITHDTSLSNRAIPQAVHILSHHMHSITFLPVSPLWRHLRTICNVQLFSNTTLNASQDLRRKKLQDLLSDIERSSLVGEAVDIGRAVFKTSINLLSNTFFSVDFVDSAAGSIGDFKELAVKIMQECGKPNLADFFPALRMVDPQGIKRRNRSYTAKVIDIFRGFIDQRMKLREEQGYVDTNNDMLNTLLNIAQHNPQDMNKTQIQHLALTMYVAGTDTTASTLEWAMAELVRNEKVMAKAKEEMEQVIGKGKPVEESDIQRLPYLQAILKEIFRLYPPVPFLVPRKANQSVEIGGYTIPKDAQIFVNVWAIGRSSSVWKNADSFSPERFLNSEIDFKGHSYELTPFGAGRRVCPAIPLATRMLYLMLGSLINCFDWELQDYGDMNMDDSFGISVAKVQPVRVVPRKVATSNQGDA